LKKVFPLVMPLEEGWGIEFAKGIGPIVPNTVL